MQREFLPAIVEFEIGEGNVADGRVDAPFGQRRVAEAFNADVMIGMKGFGDPSGNSVQLDCDEPLSALSVPDEIANPASGLQDGGVVGDAQPVDRFVDRSDDRRRRVESVEGRALGAVVFLGLQQRLERFAQVAPAGVFVTPADRIGKNRQGDGSETREFRKSVFLLLIRGPPLGLDAL